MVSTVAAAYLQLRELDLELDISQRTLATREESLRIIKLRTDAGVATALDLRQAEQLVYSARAAIPDLQRSYRTTGEPDQSVVGSESGAQFRVVGSWLLRNSLPLYQRACLPICCNAVLISAPPNRLWWRQTSALKQPGQHTFRAFHLAVFWEEIAPRSPVCLPVPEVFGVLAAQVTQPIFTAGRLKSNVKLNKAQQESAIVGYQSTVQGAFREVSDALIAYRKNREVRAQQELLVADTSRALASRLSAV